MINLVNALARKFRAVFVNLREKRLPGKNLFVKHRAGRIETENLAKRSVIKAVSDLVYVRDPQPSLLEAVGDRLGGKVAALLASIETLLRRRRHYHAVHDERSCGVETLQNPVFPFLQSWPMCALEANRVGKPAQTQNCGHR